MEGLGRKMKGKEREPASGGPVALPFQQRANEHYDNSDSSSLEAAVII